MGLLDKLSNKFEQAADKLWDVAETYIESDEKETAAMVDALKNNRTRTFDTDNLDTMELIQCFDLPPVIKICRDIKAREVYYNLHFNLTDMEWRFYVCDKSDEELFQIKKDPFVHRDGRVEDRESNVTNTRLVNGDKTIIRGFSADLTMAWK